MQIGILTFHYAHNYGAVLQAYALKEYLNRIGHTAKIIDYRNPTIEKKYYMKLPKELSLRQAVHGKRYRKFISQEMNMMSEQPSWTLQNIRFKKFIQKYLLDKSSKRVNKFSVGNLQFDCFIAGSDQLWNKYLTDGYDDIYFLNFDTKAKKVFYAISDGNFRIADENLAYYRQVLDSVSFISTREKSLALDIRSKLHKDACYVVDPTFLLTNQDYIRAFHLQKKSKILFAYYIVEDAFMSKIVQVIARALNLKILELHFYKKRYMKEKYMRADLGPVDFLESIFRAEFVVTNSFHGTALSIIFQKQFYCVYQQDARKDNLLAELSLRERQIKSPSDMDLNQTIDYSKINLEKYTEYSKKYIASI